MPLPLVSLIVPVYNVQEFIGKCTNSLLNQVYNNLEIILVDDGATDNSGVICDELSLLFPRIISIHKQNGGLSDARNIGLQHSSGILFSFVDSDDYIHPEYISRMVNALLVNNLDLAICGFQRVDIDGDIIPVKFDTCADQTTVLSRDEIIHYYASDEGWWITPAWNKLYSKKVWGSILFPKGKLHEDEFVIHHILTNCDRVLLLSDKLYFYVQRQNSIMSTRSERNILDTTEAMLDRVQTLVSNHYLNEAKYFFEGAIYKLEYIHNFGKKAKELTDTLQSIYIENTYLISNINLRIRYYSVCNGNHLATMLENLRKVHRKLLSLKNDNIVKYCANNYIVLVKLALTENINNRVILMSTPMHGNLGDQTIVYSEYRFLHDQGYTNIVEISRYQYDRCKTILKERIRENDLIIICGGGNMGTLWPEEDDIISSIISTFNNNRIIIFPQSCYYDFNLNTAQARLENNKRIYEMCNSLIVVLREKPSYNRFRAYFPNINAILCPDIVLYCNKVKINQKKRNRVLLCFRSDCEKAISNSIETDIEKMLDSIGVQYFKKDTVVHKKISCFNRNRNISLLLKQYSSSKLVITDRLHGMIFSVITKTPCIALNNRSGKVHDLYLTWLTSCAYIRCIDSEDISIKDILDMMEKIGSVDIDIGSFELLKEAIKYDQKVER